MECNINDIIFLYLILHNRRQPSVPFQFCNIQCSHLNVYTEPEEAGMLTSHFEFSISQFYSRFYKVTVIYFTIQVALSKGVKCNILFQCEIFVVENEPKNLLSETCAP